MNTTESSTIQLSLRPATTENNGAQTLAEQIWRINAERGHFRNVTEEGLRREIEAQEAGLVETTEGNDVEEEDKVHTREGLAAARLELIRYVGQAYQEAAMALDFISLLLSKDAPTQGTQSMSPALKSLVPPGTIHYEKWPPTQRTNAELRNEDVVTKGWKMQSLNAAADSLLAGAARLEKEVKKETKYWEQVLSLSREGWAIRRVPQRKNVLGVQFGTVEAAPRFRSRGFSALRSNNEGDIILDEELTQRPEAIRVRIRHYDKIVGSSRLAAIDTTAQAPIEELVHRARDTLFEQELYQEMILEARQLHGYYVETRDGVIQAPIKSSKPSNSISGGPNEASENILIDKIYLDETLDEYDDHTQDAFAERVVLALRVLLAHGYRQRLHLRSQIPPPMTEKERKPPVTAILRPLLTVLQHWTDLGLLRKYLETTCSIRREAGADASFTLRAGLNLASAESEAESTADAVVGSLTGPLETEAMLRVPEQNFKIMLRTQMGPPSFGSEFRVSVVGEPGAARRRGDRSFENFGKLERFLDSRVKGASNAARQEAEMLNQ
ncbi:RNA polymerase II mediator complex subunit [Coniosporium tulheliwenetii]|uniref:RNA polymerase II mediator complex subunit n=1 Tax=Coniosporium tulheliwenetii TaxID=3383036 RepID=A0ACC2ZQ05_9PEZI|nr:RNA polymerase II mediator complex subunit [Cladosporium sp. JES 115]